MRVRVFAVVVVVLAGCREPGLQGSTGTLRFSPEKLDFGGLWAGHEGRELTFKVVNQGHSTLPLRWESMALPFEVDALPAEAPTGGLLITARFRPSEAGKYAGVLRARSDGDLTLGLPMVGEGRDLPSCPPPGAECAESVFDLGLGRCVDRALADGSTCDARSACVLSSTCQAGRCVGVEKSCDDANLCTLDTCNAVVGCEHLPAPPCPGDGKCQVGTCEPSKGCGLAPADDGTACGPIQTCDVAQVCIAGNCELRDPPDGYVCAEASPCQEQGLCTGSTCARPNATLLSEGWRFNSAAAAEGEEGRKLHDFVLEPSGAASMMGFFETPALRLNTLQAVEAPAGPARRCILWNGRLVCADYPSAVGGKVSALDLATGAIAWTFDLRVARPDFVPITSALFFARLAVQGSDRLAALYEAYPHGASDFTTCRLYFLVVLDASGKLVTSQQVKDTMLETCNHPHPYGFAADAQGDLFISFSSTISDHAPLVPASPTLMMSYTRDGIFRWKFTDFGLVGGELAIASGLLYPENSPIAVLASSGQPAFSLSEPFGRAVVTRERTVVAPLPGAVSLNGYESGMPTPRWKHVLAPGQTFWSDQLRLARWATHDGSQTVALTFTRQFGLKQLHAIRTRDGSEAFTCNLAGDFTGAPQLFEVANGSLALMEGSSACGKCDPPFAGSSAVFHTFNLPTISISNDEPWVGTFGGAGHDHREEVLVTPPAKPPE